MSQSPLHGTSSLNTRAGAFDATRRQPISKTGGLQPGWDPNRWEPTKQQALRALKNKRWYRTTDAAVTEASIDHMTPALYRSALKAQRETSKPFLKRKAVKFLGHLGRARMSSGREFSPSVKHHVSVLKLPKFAAKAGFGGFAAPLGYSDKKGAERSAVVLKRTPKGQKPDAQTKQIAAHEFLHVADYKGTDAAIKKSEKTIEKIGLRGVLKKKIGMMKGMAQGDPEAFAKYTGDRRERHAYAGTAGTLGVREYKKAGVSAAGMRHAMRKGQYSDTSGALAVPHALYKSSSGFSKRGRKDFQKLGKEIHKGVERIYGARKKVIGRNKLGVPVGKLPEGTRAVLSRAIIEAIKKTPGNHGLGGYKIKTPALNTSEPPDMEGSVGFSGPCGATAHAY